jgi:hypothetical protein
MVEAEDRPAFRVKHLLDSGQIVQQGLYGWNARWTAHVDMRDLMVGHRESLRCSGVEEFMAELPRTANTAALRSARLMRIGRFTAVIPYSESTTIRAVQFGVRDNLAADAVHGAKIGGERIRISRRDGASARCSASNHPDHPSASCPSTPLSKTPSTSGAISPPAARFYRLA